MRFWSRRESPAAAASQPPHSGTSATAPAAAPAAAANATAAADSSNDSSAPAVLTSADIRRQLARLMDDAAGWMDANRLAVRWAALAAAAGSLAFLLHGGHVSGWRQCTSFADVLPQLLAGEARRIPVILHSVEQHGAVVAVRVAHHPLLRRLAARYRGHPPSLTAQRAEQRGHLLTAYLAGPARLTPAGMQYLEQYLDREAVHYLRPLSVVLAEESPWALEAASNAAVPGAAAAAGAAVQPAALAGAAVQSAGPAGAPAAQLGAAISAAATQPAAVTTAAGAAAAAAAAAVQPAALAGPAEVEGARRAAGCAGTDSDGSSSGGNCGGSSSSSGADSTADGVRIQRSALSADRQLGSSAAAPAQPPDGPQHAASAPQGGTQQHIGAQAGAPPLQLWGELHARCLRHHGLGALLPRRRRDVAELLIRRGEAAAMDPEDLEWLGVSPHRAHSLSAAERSAVHKGLGMWATQRPSLADWCRGLALRARQQWRGAARPS